MEVQRDDILINECRSCIENQLGWGSSDSWSMQEFEVLSDRITEKTGIYLSVTTLKRLWGKVKYESKPTITTLNALAKFLDFESWRDFRKSKHADLLQKTILKEGAFAYAILEYPESEKEIFDKVSTRLFRSFK